MSFSPQIDLVSITTLLTLKIEHVIGIDCAAYVLPLSINSMAFSILPKLRISAFQSAI